MIRAVATASALGAVLLLAACSAPTPPPSSPTVSRAPVRSAPVSSKTSTPSSTPTSSAESSFVTVTGTASQALAALPPTTRLALGRAICTGFAAGRSEQQVADALQQDPGTAALSGTDVAILLGGAVAAICPQYRAKLSD